MRNVEQTHAPKTYAKYLANICTTACAEFLKTLRAKHLREIYLKRKYVKTDTKCLTQLVPKPARNV